MINQKTRAKGLVVDVKRCAVHDGPGIRTTVFLKGCPLRCLWCHNPESMRSSIQIKSLPGQCIGCGRCVEVCPAGCHVIDEAGHQFDRGNCQSCGRCSEACPAGALQRVGVCRSAEEIMGQVLRDVRYFEQSGGGVTLSGGEPLAQPGFSRALLAEAKAHDLHTCLDTSGHAPFEHFEVILGLVDLFLYDLKETDPVRHKQYTGVDNRLILENLGRLADCGATIILRCPIIPGYNDRADHFHRIAELVAGHSAITEVNVMAFHPFGASKSEQVGLTSSLPAMKAVDQGTRQHWLDQLSRICPVPVRPG